MPDKYTRRFLCYIRLVLYAAAIWATAKGYDHLGFFLLFFAFILLGDKYRRDFYLIKRYKWYGYSCIVYYVFVLIYVINNSDCIVSAFFTFFLVLPLIPEIVVIEITEFIQSKDHP